MITAIILSWKRLQNLPLLLNNLATSREVSEVIICNNNPNILPFYVVGNVTVLNSSKDLGLWTRFSAALLAKNDLILYIDDDLSFPSESIQALYYSYLSDPEIIHGAFGRNLLNKKYNTLNAYGRVPIVLTRAVLTHREYCLDASYHIRNIDRLKGTPRGNGEDILLSYCAMKRSKKLNNAIQVKLEELDSSDLNSIHLRVQNHVEYRSEVVRYCEEYLIQSGKLS